MFGANKNTEALQLKITALEDALFMRKKIIDGCDKKMKEFEDTLLLHQELTQWIEEEITNENDKDVLECSHDFLQNLYNRVTKINNL